MKLRFLWSWLINAFAFYIVSLLIHGLKFTGIWPIIWSALILGLVNAIIKPILMLISIPLTIITLGLFTLIINAFVLEIVAFIVPGFSITSFFWVAILGAFLLSVISTLLTWLLFPKQNFFQRRIS